MRWITPLVGHFENLDASFAPYAHLIPFATVKVEYLTP